MKQIGIEDLKKASYLWCNHGKKSWSVYERVNGELVSDWTLLHIPSNIIIDNIYYNWYKFFEAKTESKYIKIEKEIKNNGWSDDYPGKLMFTKQGGILFWDGSHRINMCVDMKKPMLIPVVCPFIDLKYHKSWREWEEKIKHAFPYGYLPKWEWGKK